MGYGKGVVREVGRTKGGGEEEGGGGGRIDVEMGSGRRR